MYHVSAQGVDERMINVHYYYIIVIMSINSKLILDKQKEKKQFVNILVSYIRLPTGL